MQDGSLFSWCSQKEENPPRNIGVYYACCACFVRPIEKCFLSLFWLMKQLPLLKFSPVASCLGMTGQWATCLGLFFICWFTGIFLKI
jgi:hypothetical protein